MNLPQNVTTNISIPFIGAVVAAIATTHPEVGVAWLGISQTYLFLKAMDPRIDDFMGKVKKHTGEITAELVTSREFQQSILATFDALIRTRNTQKREIVKNIYLFGYIEAADKSTFELERFYQTSQNISIEAVNYLRFMRDTTVPMKMAEVRKKVTGVPKGEANAQWWSEKARRTELDSNYVMKWIHENFKEEEEEELRQQDKFSEIAAELLSLGIFRTVPTFDHTGYILTNFGDEYMSFLQK